MPVHNDGVPPTPFELRLRFACGAVFGALVTAWSLFSIVGPSVLTAVAGIAVGGLGGGLLARRHGDPFWFGLRRWFWFR